MSQSYLQESCVPDSPERRLFLACKLSEIFCRLCLIVTYWSIIFFLLQYIQLVLNLQNSSSQNNLLKPKLMTEQQQSSEVVISMWCDQKSSSTMAFCDSSSIDVICLKSCYFECYSYFKAFRLNLKHICCQDFVTHKAMQQKSANLFNVNDQQLANGMPLLACQLTKNSINGST